MATLETLPIEMLQKIYSVCPSIEDVISISSTCKWAHKAFDGPHKLRIIEAVVQNSFGPIEDAIKLVTYTESKQLNSFGSPAISLSLLKQVDQVGRIASQWADLYPMEKWKWNYESRRRLTSYERYKLRRAVYRIWLYGDIFHNIKHLSSPQNWKAQQYQFLRNFSSTEAEEMLDMDSIFGSVLEDLCPDNGTVSIRAKEKCHNNDLYFGSLASTTLQNARPTLDPTAMEYESWGDSASVVGIIGELKKLNPRQLIEFKELKTGWERKEFRRQMDYEYQGRFRGTWSQLYDLLSSYLKTDGEMVVAQGGIIADY